MSTRRCVTSSSPINRLDVVTRRLLPALALVLALSHAQAAASPWTDPRAIPLVDQGGRTFRLNDFAGTPVVLTFVAARCTDACPIANAAFARTYARLRHDRIAVRFVTVTLDPDHDSPLVMAGLARPFGVDREAWRFASGRPADVRQLMRSLRVDVEPDAHGVPDSHSTSVYILDRDVRLARTLLLSTALTPEVEDAVLKLPPRSEL
jgi:protein SCO1/2